ncbi:MAG TPA: protein translocase subunit SecDF [Candidatus Alistipes intestinigallinarum]|uniref:Multifunctional fusion protein n=1 Tax=Candidatus Alistipes intestinigallinarum TaxID=2838440 RepID=A0A9D1Z0I9_9BACT|nr:protein translocase subunit SecDF [Candidatus Alistipes intestinigallinarum]
MQSKGFIKLIAVLLGLACVYQLSFTFKTRSVEKKAAEYAAQFPLDEQSAAEQHYLDSVQNLQVFNLGFKKFTYKECKEKELNLGLDLKGGMNVMLEVQVEDVVKALAGDSQNDPAFKEAIAEANEALKQGSSSDYIGDFVKAYSRISNGRPLAEIFVSPDRSDITLESSDADVEKVLKRETDAAIGASFNVLRSRIDHFGVTQPNIMRLPNSHRILVELPGVKEPQRVRDLLQGTASLEFWLTYDANEVIPALVSADKLLKEELTQAAAQTEPVAEETSAAEAAATEDQGLIGEIGADSTASADAVQTDHFDREQNPLFAVLDPNYAGGAAIGAAYKADMAAVNEYLSRPEVRELFPADILFKWGVKGDDHIDGRYYLYAIKVTTPDGKAPLDGSVVTDAREQYAQRGATAEVSMTMNAEGTQEWARLTGENIGKCIAIVLDGYVYSAPRVNTKIDKGQSQITGDFTIQEAQDLANVLNSGKVPAPAKIIQDTVVGPSLGQESINAGMLSFVIAFILVLLYMSLFYKTAGWMADIALLVNVFLLMGVLASFGAVLTLPGIAGIVLTMGMAVDANVIIYERIKEELREGKGISLAIKDGFSRAYSAIIDGQLTTIITGIVLFVFGTGPVQGFATTLIIGIITSIFCSIFITRLLIEWIVAKWGSISFSHKWSENFLCNTHVDFLSKRKIAYVISAVAIVLSIASFFVRGLNLGAEFTGGRAYVVRFDKPVSAEAVRASMEETFSQITDADASSISFEVKQYGNENQMRIVTQYRYDDMSDEATAEVEQVIYDALKSLYSYPITFDQFRSTQTDVNGILTADKIGPSIAKDMTWNAIYSVLFSLIAIGLYITFRFKRWQWATGATLALAFNALLIIGIFSMFYGILPFNLEVNQAFIAAILTIIGYAINDTVVVFDRIREYLGLYPKRNLKENVNNAINSTLSRTINTSGTTLVTLLAIFFFGGETIRGFIFALIIGVIVGTAATIFIATPIAYDLMAKRAKIDEE